MSTNQGSGLVLLARLHAVLDDLLALDPADIPTVDLPELVTGLVRLGHRVHAAQLDAVGALDASGVPAGSAHRSTARWVQHQARVPAAQAGGLVASARTLREHLPATRDALAAGQISGQHVAAITHVVATVGAEHAVAAEPVLLDLALAWDPAVVRRATAHLHAVLDPDGAQAALDKVHARRGVTLSVVGSRAYLDGVLDIEAAEVLHTALMPLMAPTPGDGRTAPQRRADALVDLARRALDTGQLPMLGGQRPHLSLLIHGRDLTEGRGTATLPWTGHAVPVPTVLRWGCDTTLTPIWATALRTTAPTSGGRGGRGGGWQPLAVGRSSRTVTPAQLKALQVRDGGCVHPGCTRTPAFCDAHHIHHWAHGGATDLPNLILLCRHHHRTLHSRHWTLEPAPPGAGPPGEGLVHSHVAVLSPGHREPLQTATDRSPPLGRPA
jgi:hypothetical protein